MKQMFGVCLHFFDTKTYLRSASIIERCETPSVYTAYVLKGVLGTLNTLCYGFL